MLLMVADNKLVRQAVNLVLASNS